MENCNVWSKPSVSARLCSVSVVVPRTSYYRYVSRFDYYRWCMRILVVLGYVYNSGNAWANGKNLFSTQRSKVRNNRSQTLSKRIC
jgi:hypothetical protein